MSTPAERLAEIEANYTRALINEVHDLQAAQTVEEVNAVQLNRAQAGQAFFAAVKALLTKAGGNVEAAHKAAKDANKAVADARDAVEAFPRLLKKLTGATEAATKLLNTASGA